MRLTQVALGVWTATAATWATLTTVVVADDGACLVVDPGITVQEVTALAAEIGSRGWRCVAGFATHPHWDHVLWASALGDGPRWATALATRTAGENRSQILAGADADAPGHDHRFTAVLTPLPDGAGQLPWHGPRTVVVPYRAHCPGIRQQERRAAGCRGAGRRGHVLRHRGAVPRPGRTRPGGRPPRGAGSPAAGRRPARCRGAGSRPRVGGRRGRAAPAAGGRPGLPGRTGGRCVDDRSASGRPLGGRRARTPGDLGRWRPEDRLRLAARA